MIKTPKNTIFEGKIYLTKKSKGSTKHDQMVPMFRYVWPKDKYWSVKK